MSVAIISLLIILLPLAGFILLSLIGPKYLGKSAGILATFLVAVSAVLALLLAYQYFNQLGWKENQYQQIIPVNITWLDFSTASHPNFSINLGILLDPISVMMGVVVTFISLMVHLYSLSYMKGESRFAMYFAYLGIFTFSMLGLVFSSNLFQLYMCWELVGLSSFLLIGFYYQKPAAVKACLKAFIVTRFADLGFLIGILILSYHGGTLDFAGLIHELTTTGTNGLQSATASSFLGISALTWGLMLVFMGGAGKSALFPLHIWLPDAMEGPTPVSALIHAATMVVAGVFLLARLFPIYAISAPHTLNWIAYTGVITACIAAVIACTQSDIKRVLAYSTMSQIGFMIFALAVSGYAGEAGLGYTASLFHLFTHAFFKALLFLGAGAIIHFAHSNDMNAMGGLRRYMPITHATFLLACLAISGIPPFSGFFSKEEILLASYQSNKIIYSLALVTSMLTAFYMFRLYFKIFWHRDYVQQRASQGEGGGLMMVPMLILAICTLLVGWIPFGQYISSDGKPITLHVDLMFSIAPVLMAIFGIFMAAYFYKKQEHRSAKWVAAMPGLYRMAVNKFYIDEIYLFITRKLIFNKMAKPAAWVDKNIVDEMVNTTGEGTNVLAKSIRGVQSGRVQQYALWFLLAVIGLSVLFVFVWK